MSLRKAFSRSICPGITWTWSSPGTWRGRRWSCWRLFRFPRKRLRHDIQVDFSLLGFWHCSRQFLLYGVCGQASDFSKQEEVYQGRNELGTINQSSIAQNKILLPRWTWLHWFLTSSPSSSLVLRIWTSLGKLGRSSGFCGLWEFSGSSRWFDILWDFKVWSTPCIRHKVKSSELFMVLVKSWYQSSPSTNPYKH